MALMIDSVTPAAIPKGTPVVAGYVDGPYGPDDPYGSGWTAAAWASFPGSQMVVITVNGMAGAHVYDIETGDGTPAQGAAWAKAEVAAGRRPTLYANQSTWDTALDAELAAVGLARVTSVDGWLALYDGKPDLPAGFVAHQYAQDVISPIDGSYIDYSVTDNVWPGGAAPSHPPCNPPPPPPGGEDMIARDSKTGGAWIVRPNANVYAFFGAPYLGPLPKYTSQWGIGTAANPVTGIVSDDAGGFLLSTDNGGPVPAVWHITVDGQYAK